jgi:hypothetical protein
MNEVRERFLKAILERLPVERIAEIHFFPSIRQGPIETGAAVIGAYPEPAHTAVVAVVEETTDDQGDVVEEAAEVVVAVERDPRYVVHTASYRWTRKGPDRGKWEVDVIAQADAPLPMVDIVVRGVNERSGDAIESQRLTHEELEAIVSEPSWQTAP